MTVQDLTTKMLKYGNENSTSDSDRFTFIHEVLDFLGYFKGIDFVGVVKGEEEPLLCNEASTVSAWISSMKRHETVTIHFLQNHSRHQHQEPPSHHTSSAVCRLDTSHLCRISQCRKCTRSTDHHCIVSSKPPERQNILSGERTGSGTSATSNWPSERICTG